MSRQLTSFVVFGLIAATASVASAKWSIPGTNIEIPSSTIDIQNQIGDGTRGIDITGNKKLGPSVSVTQAVVYPFIDQHGNVYSGTNSGGGSGAIVGKASLVREPSGQAFWVATYQGMNLRTPAPQYNVMPNMVGGMAGRPLQLGQLSFTNDTGMYSRIRLYHPQAPGQVYGEYPLNAGAQGLIYHGNQPIYLGSDWGVQLVDANGVASSMKPLGNVAGHDGQNFHLQVSRLR